MHLVYCHEKNTICSGCFTELERKLNFKNQWPMWPHINISYKIGNWCEAYQLSAAVIYNFKVILTDRTFVLQCDQMMK